MGRETSSGLLAVSCRPSRLTKKWAHRLEGPLGGAPELLGELLGALAHRVGLGGMLEQLLQQRGEFLCASELPGGVVRQELVADLGKIVHPDKNFPT